MTLRAIDTWVNVNMGEMGRPDYLVQVASRYFKQGEDFFRNYEVAETLELMDASGVELFPVAGDVVVGVVERPPQALGLQCGDLVAARDLDRVDLRFDAHCLVRRAIARPAGGLRDRRSSPR